MIRMASFDGLAAGETATDSFSYTVSDGQGGTSTASVDRHHRGAGSGRTRALGRVGGPCLRIPVLRRTTRSPAIRRLPARSLRTSRPVGCFARIAGAASADFVDISEALQADGGFVLDAAPARNRSNGDPLDDGFQTITLFATDDSDNRSASRTVSYTLDRAAPAVETAPSGVLSTAPATLRIQFDDSVADGGFTRSNFALTDESGEPIAITSVDRLSATTAQLNLASPLPKR